MRPGLGQHTQLKQELKINPRLYQAMDLLYMPLLDLQNHLKQELLNNPFLDMIEPDEEDEEEGVEQQEETSPETEAEKEEKGEIDWEEILLDGFDTGAQPESALVAGADGSFYGTTTAGGLGGHGTVFRLSFAPQIITQPTNQTVLAGTSAAFAVSLFGSQPLFCQWRFNGSPLTDGGNISGSGTSTLTISNVSPLNAGKYSLSVSNALGSITSTGALLAVVSPPVFQTVSQTNGALTLTWSAAPGQTYQLQYKSELASTNWLNLGDAIVATSPAVTASDVIGFNSKRFYRVVLIP